MHVLTLSHHAPAYIEVRWQYVHYCIMLLGDIYITHTVVMNKYNTFLYNDDDNEQTALG